MGLSLEHLALWKQHTFSFQLLYIATSTPLLLSLEVPFIATGQKPAAPHPLLLI
jgi:hypothetical protein